MYQHEGPDTQRGFTLIELMFVVAIIALLAIVAVPYFFGETRKSKARTEISSFFAELQTKEEQYKIDQGSYLAAPACPPMPSSTLQDALVCQANGTPWATMRVQLPSTQCYCSYTIMIGLPTDVPAPPVPYTMSQPASSWYFIVATCDMDGDPATYSTYFTSSLDSRIQSDKEGR